MGKLPAPLPSASGSGCEIRTDHEVIAIEQRSVGSPLIISSHIVEARHVINCAGLYADRLARLAGFLNSPRIVPFRGDDASASPTAQRHGTWVNLSST